MATARSKGHAHLACWPPPHTGWLPPLLPPRAPPGALLLLALEKSDPHLLLGLAPLPPSMGPGWGTSASQQALAAAAPWGAHLALFPWPPPLAAPLLLALALLAPPAQGCVQCRAGHRDIPARFARLCARYRQVHARPGCPSRPWSPESFKGFALDEQAMDAVTEKTHRVLRLIEINRTLSDLPKFWDWLREVKLLEYSKEVLCPPACRASALAINCSSCKKGKVPCWALKKCYPGRRDLRDSLLLLSVLSASSLLVGVITCALQFRFYPLPE